MTIKVDENLPASVGEFLRDRGFDAHTVAEEDLVGSADSNLFDVARHDLRASAVKVGSGRASGGAW